MHCVMNFSFMAPLPYYGPLGLQFQPTNQFGCPEYDIFTVKVKTRIEGQNSVPSFSRPRVVPRVLLILMESLQMRNLFFCGFALILQDFVDSASKQIFKACRTFSDVWNQVLCFVVQFYFHCETMKSFEEARFVL